MTSILFRETQRFRQPWLWLLLALAPILAGFAFVRQLLMHQPVGANPMSDAAAWVVLPLVGLGLPAFFALLRLTVTVSGETVEVHFFPLRRRRIPLESLASVEAATYRPILDYGGWGIRLGARGWAYTLSGHEGVILHFKDGSQLLVGSRRSQALAEAVAARLHP